MKSAESTATKVADYQSAETSNLTKYGKARQRKPQRRRGCGRGRRRHGPGPRVLPSIGNSLEKAIGVMRAMTQDARALSEAASQGQLDTRADESQYKGEYRAIIRGMNASLEGFAVPLADIGQALKRLADKDFSQTIDKQYPGAYGELRDNVNLVVTSFRAAISRSPKAPISSPRASRDRRELANAGPRRQTQSAGVQEMTASIEDWPARSRW